MNKMQRKLDKSTHHQNDGNFQNALWNNYNAKNENAFFLIIRKKHSALKLQNVSYCFEVVSTERLRFSSNFLGCFSALFNYVLWELARGFNNKWLLQIISCVMKT